MQIEYFNGYEIFALCNSQSSETLSFNEFRAELSDGYRQQASYGSSTGTRSWNLSFKTLTGQGYNPSIDLDGTAMATAVYLQDLFIRSKNSGTPFIIKSPVNDQYYLAEFADSSITFDRALVKLFSSGVAFRQVRLPNVSVFDFTKANPWGFYEIETIDENFDDEEALIDTTWADSSGNGNDLGITIGGTYKEDEQNGLGAVRLNGTSGFFQHAEAATIYQALMVIRIYEATWSNIGGVLTGATTDALLVGDGSGTKFFNLSLDNLIYQKNGISYAQSNQQSPMDEFALVYVHYPEGMEFDAVQIGKDRDFVGRFAKLDIGSMVFWDSPQPENVILEATEALIIKWGL